MADPKSITDELVGSLDSLRFSLPVTHVYNPLVYARAAHDSYLERYGMGHREVVLLGMNPGPFGMAQTGVPFGDVTMVRDWMGIHAAVGKPDHEHPKRPVDGFDCARSEVSGSRLWGWAQQTFGAPERFFSRFMILNYCPLCFMEDSGRNRTPDKLPSNERLPLFDACDRALRAYLDYYRPEWALGIGAFAEARLEAVQRETDSFDVARLLHPSPASPAANRGWAAAASKTLKKLGICST